VTTRWTLDSVTGVKPDASGFNSAVVPALLLAAVRTCPVVAGDGDSLTATAGLASLPPSSASPAAGASTRPAR
jgi:hypothetical protein